jgi:hypothetical protein
MELTGELACFSSQVEGLILERLGAFRGQVRLSGSWPQNGPLRRLLWPVPWPEYYQ